MENEFKSRGESNLMKIGVIGLQGAISEHLEAVEQAMKALEVKGEASWVRKAEEIDELDGVVIPGARARPSGNS